MPRLNNRQLHIILGILIVMSVFIGIVFGFNGRDTVPDKEKMSTLDNISDGWIVTYETLDEAKWKKYGIETGDLDKKMVSEVLNLPNTFSVKAGNTVELKHKIPDMTEKRLYLVFNLKRQRIQVAADRDVIYETSDADYNFPYHIIPVDYRYRNGNLTLTVVNENHDKIELDEIKMGTFTQLLSDAANENGVFILFGLFLTVVSIGLIVISLVLKTDTGRKQMLNYSCLLSFLTGLLFFVQSRIFRVMLRWEYMFYYIRSCMLIILAVAYLLVIRCLIKRKKILSIVDLGIVFYCILFISVIVLQWFSLLTFDKIYIITFIMLAAGVMAYTMLMGTAAYDYKQNEERPVFIANVILIVMGIIELVMYIMGSDSGVSGTPIISGCFIYYMILWNYGLKRAVGTDDNKEPEDMEKPIRDQVIGELNPNLIFASFQTLQKLIRNGSENSTKMLYYISVYLMNNLKAMSNRGDIIPFDDELEHIMSYLQLQRTRNNRLAFAMECKIRDFKIPRNSLEPIVENAVKYGVGGKDNKGNVVIRTYEREDGYAVQIIDDGIGFDTKKLGKSSPTALRNLFAMLEDKCKAVTEVISKEGKGTVITIVLPMIDNELM